MPTTSIGTKRHLIRSILAAKAYHVLNFIIVKNMDKKMIFYNYKLNTPLLFNYIIL